MPRLDSNQQPATSKDAALPVAPLGIRQVDEMVSVVVGGMVARVGVEPTVSDLKGRQLNRMSHAP